MYRSDHVKSDGRRITLYSRRPITEVRFANLPVLAPTSRAQSHLRWHPLAGEWVIYASHRQDRTFLPAGHASPLTPSSDPARPSELPEGDYDVAVFDNRFPSLVPNAGPAPYIIDVGTAPAEGACEVVVFSKDPSIGLAEMPIDELAGVIDVWADRTVVLAKAKLKYVLPFENRGVEMGVTLHHPHGQIYAYGFLPAVQARALEAMQQHWKKRHSTLVTDVASTARAQMLVITSTKEVIAFVPPFARFPFEIWVVPMRPVAMLTSLTSAARLDLASALSEVLRRLDRLFGKPMPYLLTVNQAPTDKDSYPEWATYIAIMPIRRAPEKLKYLAGTELGAGVFASDLLPEQAAAALRRMVL